MRLIKLFIRENTFLFFGTLTLLAIQFATILYIPYLVAHIIDDGIIMNDFHVVRRLGIEMLMVSIVGVLVALACSYYSSVIATKFGTSLRLSIFRKVQHLAVTDVENYGTSALTSRITSDVVNVQQVVVMIFQMILPGPIVGVICIIMSFMISPEMGWIAMIVVGLFILAAGIVTWLSFPYLQSIQTYLDQMMLVLREFFIGVRIIRAFDNSTYEEKRTNNTFKDYANNMIHINKLFAYLTPAAYSLLGFSMIAILWFGLIKVPSGAIPIGQVTAVIEYTTLAILTFIMSALVIVMLPRAYAALLRIEDILSFDETIKDVSKSPDNIIDSDTNKVITFENISFDYDGRDNYAINDISFSIRRGETVAVIGATGSGKSTIAKLILRLFDPSHGTVKYFGTDIRLLSQHFLRDNISYVPQKALLFSGTIEANIKYHNQDLSDEEMVHASKIAQADDFIAKLDDGYKSTVARGGANFSGGQKQRISIARALSKPSQLYIFDDSFSALDYKTDATLRSALKQHLKDKALLIIAQRVSSIMHADNIIVMDNGKIIGIGQHDDLIQNNDTYKKFAKSQFIIE